MNAHGTIYVVTPEYNSNSQMIFRDNIQPMIQGKHVIVLMASVTTGITIRKKAWNASPIMAACSWEYPRFSAQ